LFLITEIFPYSKIVAKLNQFISMSKLLHTNIIFNQKNCLYKLFFTDKKKKEVTSSHLQD